MRIFHDHCIHAVVGGHLGCFWFGYHCEHILRLHSERVQTLLVGVHPGVQVLGDWVGVIQVVYSRCSINILSFGRCGERVSKVAAHVAAFKSSGCSRSLPTLGIVGFSHPGGV